ncbi:lysine N(6)-hydroxylase/L-ornithine N(5)-oxygenase family protein [Micromonospora deserti]|uniref:L-lysine N6-monooxygenase MbtG n=1 Tax=Micromonospora deserti TaxID=2070366 RepID=A0A2W2DA55_9ACTN|nr:lysine N(6)-hydroxylase/L-ornithine N(5)-oxygenase family protein [Micromonospora deserti]PZF89473.1 L-lysine 6-monooxygenase [Micromonospora deserti]
MSQVLASDASGDEPPVFDLVGIGFGPSNLAMAVALTEHNAKAGIAGAVTAHFLERQHRFGWHRGMLIEDATMQVSFLKDLVSLRNPASEFSFLSYLHSKGRLVDFVNHKSLFPLRVEFHDYFEWAAEKVDDLVSYGHEVVAVRPVVRDGAVVYLDVVAKAGACSDPAVVYRARNVVVAPGLEPCLPAGIRSSAKIWHSHELLYRAEMLRRRAPSRFVVVGAGQSAAEIVAYLHEQFPRAQVCAVFSRYGYSPADDSPFANRVFDPAAVDDYFTAPEAVKQRLMDYHRNTNYSVVDLDLIEELYRRAYQERVLGVERLRMMNLARVTKVVETADRVQATVTSLITGETTVLDADAVVYATGYRAQDPTDLLIDADRYCRRDEQGRLRVARDYRVVAAPEMRCGVYLQGGTEHSHGITSSLLSNTAVRAGEILRSVVAHRDDAPVERAGLAATGTGHA